MLICSVAHFTCLNSGRLRPGRRSVTGCSRMYCKCGSGMGSPKSLKTMRWSRVLLIGLAGAASFLAVLTILHSINQSR
jgi:hypothetical protein